MVFFCIIFVFEYVLLFSATNMHLFLLAWSSILSSFFIGLLSILDTQVSVAVVVFFSYWSLVTIFVFFNKQSVNILLLNLLMFIDVFYYKVSDIVAKIFSIVIHRIFNAVNIVISELAYLNLAVTE